VIEGGTVTAGNASQLSDGASACVLMEARLAQQRGVAPLGLYRGMTVVGNAPEEMGIGPIYAVPKLLKLHGLAVDDIGLWELNEAFACQALYCRDQLGIDPDQYNVDGGAIAIGHPYGMTGRGSSGMRSSKASAAASSMSSSRCASVAEWAPRACSKCCDAGTPRTRRTGMSVRALFDLTGKTAIVTGGSRGIGVQMANALGEMGARVVLTARKENELAAARAELERQAIECLTIACDLSDFGAIPAMVAGVLDRWGQIDIW
jgi:hypothetical protein